MRSFLAFPIRIITKILIFLAMFFTGAAYISGCIALQIQYGGRRK